MITHNSQYKIGIVTIDNNVEPKVKSTAFSVSPSYRSENADANPAVGIAKAIKKPRIISSSTGITKRNSNDIPTAKTGNATNLIAAT